MSDQTLMEPPQVRDDRAQYVGAGLWLLMVVAAVGSLVACYYAIRNSNDPWLPSEAEFDPYLGMVWLACAALPSAFVFWAGWAAKKRLRSQAIAALGLALALSLAFINIAIYIVSQFGYGANEGPYAVLIYALVAMVFVTAAAAIVSQLAAFGRVVSGFTDNNHTAVMIGAAWVTYAFSATGTAAWWLIWLVK